MDFSSPLDLQIAGVRDDGSAAGVMDSNIKSGLTIDVPFRDGHFSVSGAAWSTDVTGGGANIDGSNSFLNFAEAATVPAPTPNYLKHLFYGTTYGIRFDPTFTSGGGGIYDFCVLIDRVAYRVPKQRYYADTLATWDVAGNGAHGVIVARDLPDGPHIAEINITPQAGVNGQLLYGFIADAKYYRQYPSRGYPYSLSLTASFATVQLAPNPHYRGLGLRAIIYCNLDSVQRTVTIQYNGTTIWTAVIDSGKTDIFDPKGLLAVAPASALLKHKVDAITTTAVQATVIGGH